MSEQVRIDKWLWAARFFKTRSLATEAANAGHVQVNDTVIRASRTIRIGDCVRLQRQQEHFVITVTGLAEKRGSASVARTLYEESPASIAAREALQKQRQLNAAPAPEKRPDKRARRQIIRFIRRDD
ncbi:RNA-binding S4 domain-containing protein [Mariprofundus erugo]|uniref:RNA-binding S4 domain-containing protein n=1 Tax=Mariprofundus erugo TaxID=2528639 RepID=A0A5R9GXY1_9PROT|nr:RNA-binding S4 domain-containing protein [Mariprofundus erugo]TLS68973.1 RNA-binding S4 domain-containing protein [Mariprofundus erugo]